MKEQKNSQEGRDESSRGGEHRPWVVLKFGGTSVSSLERWQAISEIVDERHREGWRVLLVCSALSQVSNRLELLIAAAEAGEGVDEGLADLRRQHEDLATEMGLNARGEVESLFSDLAQLLQGIGLTGEATPRLKARITSAGELLSTRLGTAWLVRQGLGAVWEDARNILVADPLDPTTAQPERQYLSATCDYGRDPQLAAHLDGLKTDIVVTQGFIARLPEGDTVLLGRGGSDTAAAYFAAKVGARRLEVWTDVPGLFSANPRQVPEARLLRRLGYGEAEELASKGAKVLHPRSIRPAQEHGIPVHVRCTPAPELPGTVITAEATAEEPQVKAVAGRKGLVLISMEVEGDWQSVGLIADITGQFKAHGFSIDLLASSQTNLTVVLDPSANFLEEEALEPLLTQLEKLCEPRVLRPAASVSLVGSGIREILHECAPALHCFEDSPVHMVTQSANDLSLTFVVEEERADDLVRDVHDCLFAERSLQGIFGPRWDELWDRQ